MLFFKAIVIWLIFITAESLNGVIRELWLVPALGDIRAHQVAFMSASILILAIATLFIPWLHASRSQLIQVGLLWLVLTLGFEICLGRFILGYSWSRIIADYNLIQGGLMPFGLVLVALAPLIATKLRRILPSRI
ncbi:hypothetical protein [Chroococcidiopsis sp. TS-821]|uniref:hypothetical protein n=1 Tax=Chroococcidiopsis sp. TS-821 TaxID=1378066 RepID=UPI000CEF1B87|nr:hypothetical protein [Chroococcidiopsis sp. TS-821]PPS40964.1 hypothetical protein B1A85_18820 [Chroococcidiopsis sp. TS-821]